MVEAHRLQLMSDEGVRVATPRNRLEGWGGPLRCFLRERVRAQEEYIFSKSFKFWREARREAFIFRGMTFGEKSVKSATIMHTLFQLCFCITGIS